ncbi:(p)ppGpp synthetase [Spirochaetia bacterium]|nr:(p)ppGpp synthetase [Spirochaetia bacterium]
MNIDKNALQEQYERYFPAAQSIAKYLEMSIEQAMQDIPSHLTVKSRVKDFSSFYKKYTRILKNQQKLPITDTIGIRIICPFLEDVKYAMQRLKALYTVTEIEQKGADYSFKEFGYESTHLLIQIPNECIDQWGDCACDVAEVQIRTILQDAWAEVEHELVYKTDLGPFDLSLKRKLAAVNASLGLADTIFKEIRIYQRQLNSQLEKRRGSFFKKANESIDTLNNEKLEEIDNILPLESSDSIDAILLNALYAHNRGQFALAIDLYSQILEKNPEDKVSTLIYKHRGMAYFACSQYEPSITDFTKAFEKDPHSYKSLYYRGIVWAVLENYATAVADFTLSLNINPYQSFCYYRRGFAYYHLGDLPQALADCEASLALEPSSSALNLKQLLLNKLEM